MDLNNFNSDVDIIKYISQSINSISLLDECRLFREEQLCFTEEVIAHRNCVEWIIRANGVIKNIKYALNQSLMFAQKMQSPTENTKYKTMYAYYLEDAVYRDIVLWDVFRQLLNENYKCGCLEQEQITIYKFLKQKKELVGKKRSKSILKYLNSSKHKKVRFDLRNSFTHSVECTSMYIFHRVYKDELQLDIKHLMPNHPLDNINAVVADIVELLKFFTKEVNKLRENLNNKIALLNIFVTFPCGKKEADNEVWNLFVLKENAEKIIAPCSKACDNAHIYKGQRVCKPIKVEYRSFAPIIKTVLFHILIYARYLKGEAFYQVPYLLK